MTKKKKLIFSASILLLAASALLCFFWLTGLKKADKNGMFKFEGMWFEAQKEISDEAAKKFAAKLNGYRDKFLSDKNRIFYAIVPDKSFYAQNSGYPVPNYENALKAITNSVAGMEYIDLTLSLTLDDYYVTDAHWRQERLGKVLLKLGGAMGFTVDINSFKAESYDNFIGAYSKNLPKNQKPETLYWLTNEAIDNAICKVFTTKDFEQMKVYREDKLESKTPYDIFLYGATPIVTIENPSAENKELIIFRDSYASSLAPLLIEKYSKIILVDFRYMASQILTDYVEIKNQDILFLYSTGIIADSAILR